MPVRFPMAAGRDEVLGGTPPGRAFLVGCPRSGTTLLQSMLFGHPGIQSFPETFFFPLVTPHRTLPRRLGLAAHSASAGYRRLEEIGVRGVPRTTPRWMRRCAADLVGSLDRATGATGRRAWLEKTPSHLHYVREIRRWIPQARFVHIIRDGTGTIPSLYEVTNDYPDQWEGARSLEECIERWRRDVGCSAAWAGDPGHAFVSYERLVARPDEVLEALCRFLRVPADATVIETMLEDRPRQLGLVMRDEPWKRGVANTIAKRDPSRLDERLTASQRAAVRGAADAERPTLAGLPFV
jgi:hypothetical protein